MWTPVPVTKKVKYFVTYTRYDGEVTTLGPMAKDAAEGMVSEVSRKDPPLQAYVEEWEPVRAFARGNPA